MCIWSQRCAMAAHWNSTSGYSPAGSLLILLLCAQQQIQYDLVRRLLRSCIFANKHQNSTVALLPSQVLMIQLGVSSALGTVADP